eukprot:scaffold46313_cov29-Tisochrysis_lutea.AAC.2
MVPLKAAQRSPDPPSTSLFNSCRLRPRLPLQAPRAANTRRLPSRRPFSSSSDMDGLSEDDEAGLIQRVLPLGSSLVSREDELLGARTLLGGWRARDVPLSLAGAPCARTLSGWRACDMLFFFASEPQAHTFMDGESRSSPLAKLKGCEFKFLGDRGSNTRADASELAGSAAASVAELAGPGPVLRAAEVLTV